MTEKNFRQILEMLLSKNPFQGFTIELRSGERYAVTQPCALAYRDGLVGLLAGNHVPVWFDHKSVCSIILPRAGAEPEPIDFPEPILVDARNSE